MRISQRIAVAALGAPFMRLGFDAAREPGERVALAAGLGIPSPALAVRLNGLTMVAGGAALCLGIERRVAAGVLIACLVPTTLAGHSFWTRDNAATRTKDRIHFLKNLGLAGGLAVVATTAGD